MGNGGACAKCGSLRWGRAIFRLNLTICERCMPKKRKRNGGESTEGSSFVVADNLPRNAGMRWLTREEVATIYGANQISPDYGKPCVKDPIRMEKPTLYYCRHRRET